MKKSLVLIILFYSLIGCKDEFNIPESDSYIDGDGPEMMSFVSPEEGKIYQNVSSIPIEFTVEDNYFLKSLEVEVRDQKSTSSVFGDFVTTTDSIYNYSSSFPITIGDTADYELYVTMIDEVGNIEYHTVAFSTE